MTFATVLTDDLREQALSTSPIGPAPDDLTPAGAWLWEQLAYVWQGFEEQLSKVPVIQKIEAGTVSAEEYQELLLNLRQQVIEGGRWIALTASSMSLENFRLRSLLIGHAKEEHRDYLMLETDYAAAGGDPARMHKQPKNIGSEALNAYMFHEASQPDPVHLFGAMFIIEGLGQAKVGDWATKIQSALDTKENPARFYEYHGVNDEDHYKKLRSVLSDPVITQEIAVRLVKTAKVVGRLYALQLEELGNV